jgi:hypothetical protein
MACCALRRTYMIPVCILSMRFWLYTTILPRVLSFKTLPVVPGCHRPSSKKSFASYPLPVLYNKHANDPLLPSCRIACTGLLSYDNRFRLPSKHLWTFFMCFRLVLGYGRYAGSAMPVSYCAVVCLPSCHWSLWVGAFVHGYVLELVSPLYLPLLLPGLWSFTFFYYLGCRAGLLPLLLPLLPAICCRLRWCPLPPYACLWYTCLLGFLHTAPFGAGWYIFS